MTTQSESPEPIHADTQETTMQQSDKPVLDTQRIVEELGEAACVDLFSAYGVSLDHCDATPVTAQNLSLTGIIGFTGQGVSGTCVLGSTDTPVVASMPGGGQPRDWIAELSNQLAGRLKSKLIALGVTVYITTPVVLRGTRIEPIPQNRVAPRVFRSSDGAVVLWIEVETTPEFTRSAPGEACAAEGEAILF
jgi:CheY-specific phosphatase CheX